MNNYQRYLSLKNTITNKSALARKIGVSRQMIHRYAKMTVHPSYDSTPTKNDPIHTEKSVNRKPVNLGEVYTCKLSTVNQLETLENSQSLHLPTVNCKPKSVNRKLSTNGGGKGGVLPNKEYSNNNIIVSNELVNLLERIEVLEESLKQALSIKEYMLDIMKKEAQSYIKNVAFDARNIKHSTRCNEKGVNLFTLLNRLKSSVIYRVSTQKQKTFNLSLMKRISNDDDSMEVYNRCSKYRCLMDITLLKAIVDGYVHHELLDAWRETKELEIGAKAVLDMDKAGIYTDGFKNNIPMPDFMWVDENTKHIGAMS